MNKGLISIITPCYNGEKYVGCFLDSLASQTYKNFELLFIDDGSTDATAQIVKAFMEAHKEMNIRYIYQSNAGQAAALNLGLKLFQGEYMTWPDSDDILMPENLEKKFVFLENNKGCDMVMCETEMVSEVDITKSLGVLKRNAIGKQDNLFEDFITGNNVYYVPGGFMVRSEALLKVIPDREIYADRWGQNWQILLPMAYHYKCGYIHEVLYKYVVRENSHSRKEKTYEEKMERTYHHENLLITILKGMNLIDEEKYIRMGKAIFSRRRFELALSGNKRGDVKKFYKQLKEYEKPGVKSFVKKNIKSISLLLGK